MAPVAICIFFLSLVQLQADDELRGTGRIPPASEYEVSVGALGVTHIAANRGAKRAFKSRSSDAQDLALSMVLAGESEPKLAQHSSPSVELFSVQDEDSMEKPSKKHSTPPMEEKQAKAPEYQDRIISLQATTKIAPVAREVTSATPVITNATTMLAQVNTTEVNTTKSKAPKPCKKHKKHKKAKQKDEHKEPEAAKAPEKHEVITTVAPSSSSPLQEVTSTTAPKSTSQPQSGDGSFTVNFTASTSQPTVVVPCPKGSEDPSKSSKPHPCKHKHKHDGKHSLSKTETAEGIIGERNFEARQPVSGSTPTAVVLLGTPPKELFMIMDTGSDKFVAKTWNTIRYAVEKYDPCAASLISPAAKLYDHNTSSSYRSFYKMINGTNKSKQGFIAYGSGMAYTDEGSDAVVLANTSGIKDFPVSEISMDNLQMLHAGSTSGIMGLQHMRNKSLGTSLFSEFREKGLMHTFSYCRNAGGNNGTFIWGDRSTEGTVIGVIGEMHWAIPISNIQTTINSSHAQNKTDGGGAKKDSVEDHASGLPFSRPPHFMRYFASDESSDELWRNTQMQGLLAPFQNLRTAVMDILDQPQVIKDKPDSKPPEKDLGGAKPNDSERFSVKTPKAVEVDACKGDKKCVAVIDTGSNIIAMPSEALRQLSSSVNVERDCSNFEQLPVLHFQLGEMKISLPPSAYVKKVTIDGGFGGEDALKSNKAKLALEDRTASMDTTRTQRDSLEDADTKQSRSSLQKFWDYATSFSQLGEQSSLKQRVDRMVEDVRRNQGLNLVDIIGDGDLEKALSQGITMCMASFVPIDKNTQKGALWVVGSPLFERYYTRWTYGKDDPFPSIALKEVGETQACKEKDHAVDTEVLPPTQSDLLKDQRPGFIRSDGEKKTAQATSLLSMPRIQEMNLKEIRYPHWARRVENI